MQRHPREARDALVTRSWQPGRLLVGWSLGVLMTLGLLTAMGGWYEYRQLSTTPASGSPARRVTGQESACQVDKIGAINIGGFEVVPNQPDACYLRRPRIRPWQWADGIRERVGRLSTTARLWRRAGETAEARMLHEHISACAAAPALTIGRAGGDGPGEVVHELTARWYDQARY